MSTSRELVLAALRGEKTERIPVISVCQYATYELMEKTGASWPEAHYDAGKMAQLAAGGANIFNLDAVRVPYCQTVEAEAYGAEVHGGGKEHIPSIGKNPYTLDEVPEIPKDFLKLGRVPKVIEAVKLLKAELGESKAVMGSIVGPFSVVASLIGIGQLLRASLRKPEKLKPFLEAAEQTAEQYAAALVEAGADIIVIEDMMASLDMISPKTYCQLAQPYEKKLIEAIKVPVIVHICGKLDLVMEDIAATGATAISVESKVDIAWVKKNFAAHDIKTPIIGAVRPVEELLDGRNQDVMKAVERVIREGVSIVSPDCAVAPGTTINKMLVMVEGAKMLSPQPNKN